MITINKYNVDNFIYFEANFLGGNLIAFTISELMTDLIKRFGFKLSDVTTELFHFKNLN